MNELPSSKVNRGKRLALRYAGIVVAVSALGAAYWFTRPPELVWWRSPRIGEDSRHLRFKIPAGWEWDKSQSGFLKQTGDQQEVIYTFVPNDTWPNWLRSVVPTKWEKGALEVKVFYAASRSPIPRLGWGPRSNSSERLCSAHKSVLFGPERILAVVSYSRTNSAAFNRTSQGICNSLRIE
jgi:hypothetical protein